jgi:hypothetical protein
MGIGLALMLVTKGVVTHFRPIGGPFTVDHTGNLIGGVAMILIAWSTAFALWQRVPTGIRNGFLFAATILGMFCIFQK